MLVVLKVIVQTRDVADGADLENFCGQRRWSVNRTVRAAAEFKAVGFPASIHVEAYDLATVVDAPWESTDGAGKVDTSEGSVLIKISMRMAVGIHEKPDDVTCIVDSDRLIPGCAGIIYCFVLAAAVQKSVRSRRSLIKTDNLPEIVDTHGRGLGCAGIFEVLVGHAEHWSCQYCYEQAERNQWSAVADHVCSI